jgi:TatD DNase family protein
MLPLFDAHNHLHDEWLRPHRDQMFTDLVASSVRGCVVNGTNENDWPDVAALCSGNANADPRVALVPSFGLHPCDVGNRTPHWQQHLLRHLDADRRAGVGEIGLDRWMLDRARPDDPRLVGLRRAPLDEQVEIFRWQLMVAAERNLPASIHCLDAFGALHDVLRSSPIPTRGFLLHAYNGSSELAYAFTKLGAYFSFNGAFLEPRKNRVREVYKTIAADRLLVETDAPAMRLPPGLEHFTLPATSSGDQVNHPGNLAATYAALAELRGVSIESLTGQVAQNFRTFFGCCD